MGGTLFFFDKIGFLANEGIIDKRLALRFVRDSVEIWEVLEPVIKGMAKELGTGYHKDYFEWLYREWVQFKKNPDNLKV